MQQNPASNIDRTQIDDQHHRSHRANRIARIERLFVDELHQILMDSLNLLLVDERWMKEMHDPELLPMLLWCLFV